MTDARKATMNELADVEAIVRRARPALAGHPGPNQGAALADLLATWLAGHIIPGDPAETDALREDLLTRHIAAVRDLIPVNAAMIHG